MTIRRFLSLLVLAPIGLLLSAAEAQAQDKNMQTAMDAVFGKTGEKKKLRIHGHEFNVKRAKITSQGGKLLISGQLSHHLTLRDDDQVYYVIQKQNGKVVKIDVRIKRSKLQRVFQTAQNWLKKEILNEIGSAATVKNTGNTKQSANAELKSLESTLAKVDRLRGSGWEGAAKSIIANVAARADSNGRDRLTQLRSVVGTLPKQR